MWDFGKESDHIGSIMCSILHCKRLFSRLKSVTKEYKWAISVIRKMSNEMRNSSNINFSDNLWRLECKYHVYYLEDTCEGKRNINLALSRQRKKRRKKSIMNYTYEVCIDCESFYPHLGKDICHYHDPDLIEVEIHNGH